MSLVEDSAKQPRRRGRPKKQQLALTPVAEPAEKQVRQARQKYELREPLDSADEQLAYTQEEERVSQFSSFLRHLLKHDRSEITRVASELGVAENTIYRWMNGSSEPRAIHLKNLLAVLPDQLNNLTAAINQSFPGVLDSFPSGLQEVQKDIYRRVMELVTSTTDYDTRRWQIIQAIFEYALLHLDSERQGLAITYAKLMPARADGVHSLIETMMRGNFPWSFALENHTYLGSTTLAGTAAMLERIQTWDNLSESERLQVEVDEFERSACAYPVMHAGRISGVLIVSSARPRFFSNSIACQAVVEYAQLLSLAFREEDFYPFSILNLRPMPDLKWQRAEISSSFVNRIISYARRMQVSRQEAEVLVRRDMEAEFEEVGRIHYEQRRSAKEESISTR